MGVLLIWATDLHPALQHLTQSVKREICAYCPTFRIADIRKNTLFLYDIEREQCDSFPLSIKVKKRPQLLVCKGAVYVFSIGPESNVYIENWTFRLTLQGRETHLANSPIPHICSPAALYEDDNDYMYLFGGAIKSTSHCSIQVYDPRKDLWTVIRGQFMYERSHFAVVKYYRKAYLIGGNSLHPIETFDLDTGDSEECYPQLREYNIKDSAYQWRDGLVILAKDGYVCLNLHTDLFVTYEIYSRWLGKGWYWRSFSKRIVVVGDQFYMLAHPNHWIIDLKTERLFPYL